MGLGGGLRGVQAEEADLHAALLDDGVGAEGGGILIIEVGGQDGELGLLFQGLQVGIAIVELMVAGGGQVIAHQIHQLDGGSALGDTDGGLALAEVTGIHHDDVGAGSLEHSLEGGHLGIAIHGTVDVVGVEDDDGILRLGGDGVGGDFGGGVRRGLVSHGGDRQGHRHDQRETQGQELLEFHACFTFPFPKIFRTMR